MEAITQAASAAASTVAKAAAKTLKAVAPVVEPEGKVPSTKQLELFFETAHCDRNSSHLILKEIL